MRSSKTSRTLTACLLVSALALTACATKSAPSSDIVLKERLPPLSAAEKQINPPPSGSYLNKLTTYLERVKAWRQSSREQLSNTPPK